jgi:hypothetical protein
MENRIITSWQTFEEKLDNPHQRFKFHSLLIFGFTEVSISYFEPIFSTFIYLSTLLPAHHPQIQHCLVQILQLYALLG